MTKTVLIVEDERPLQDIIRKKLEEEGLETLTARTVAQAEDYLREANRVDAIWLDHYLIGEDSGLDLVVRLKNDDKYKEIPIFVVSNTASDEKVNSYIKLGVDKYYAKIHHRLGDIVKNVCDSIK